MTPRFVHRIPGPRDPRTARSGAAGLLLAAALVAAPLVTACASSRQIQVSSGGNSVAELNTTGSTFNFRRSGDAEARTDTVGEPPEKLWSHMGQVYDALSIPVKVRDDDRRVLGTQNFTVSRHLGKDRLSLFLDCGSTITGSMADEGEVLMTVASQIGPADASGTSSVVSTIVQGTARQHGLSSSPTGCTSTGRLEHLIVTRVTLLAESGKD